MTSLNPVQRIDEHVVEAIQVHEDDTKRPSALDRVRRLTGRLGISDRRLGDYPHQLSGGMRQRVMIGLGLVLNANLIVADEATTSLDVIVEAKLLDQLREIRDALGVSILMITHNIALVAEVADRIAVMYAARMAEIGSVYDVFDTPLHPYTQGLLQSVPNIRLDERETLYKMAGEPPNLTHPPTGCRFHPRCPQAMPLCARQAPRPVRGPAGALGGLLALPGPPREEPADEQGELMNEPVQTLKNPQLAGEIIRSRGDALVQVRDLKKWFPVQKGLLDQALAGRTDYVRARRWRDVRYPSAAKCWAWPVNRAAASQPPVAPSFASRNPPPAGCISTVSISARSTRPNCVACVDGCRSSFRTRWRRSTHA